MDLHPQKQGDILVLDVSERLDSVSSPAFESALLEVIASGEHRLLLDLSDVDYMNSAGLKALLLAAKRLQPLRGRLVLCGLAPNVYTVFELTGFHRLFTITADRNQGLAAFV